MDRYQAQASWESRVNEDTHPREVRHSPNFGGNLPALYFANGVYHNRFRSGPELIEVDRRGRGGLKGEELHAGESGLPSLRRIVAGSCSTGR
jgi:hypothetical protein